MHYNKKIPLEQEFIQLFIKSFEDGEYEESENFKEHPTVTRNGKGAVIWNHIYTQLAKNFSRLGYQVGVIPRGPWELVYIYDEESKYLYTFMRESNYKNLHKSKEHEKLFHYSNVLSRINGKLKGVYESEYEQMSFVEGLNIDADTDIELSDILNRMTRNVHGEIKRYCIVLVECKKGMVQNIECIIPIAYSSPIYRENWSKYIGAEYDTTDYNVEESVPEESDILLFTNVEDIDLNYNDKAIEEKKSKEK